MLYVDTVVDKPIDIFNQIKNDKEGKKAQTGKNTCQAELTGYVGVDEFQKSEVKSQKSASKTPL